MATEATTQTRTTTSRRAPEDVGGGSLPRGWRHSGIVQWILTQPRERRETVLASGFSLLAALWAPLGILSFLAQVFGIFLAVSAIVVVAVAAPRPTVAPAVAGEHLAPQLREAWQQLRVASTHVRRELPAVVAVLAAEAAPVLRRARHRTGEAAAGAMQSLRSGADHVRQRLADLGPSPAPQSRPRSAR